MGYFLQEQAHPYVILERGSLPGNFFLTFPRHRTLLSINKEAGECTTGEACLRGDWHSLLSTTPSFSFRHFTERDFPLADDFLQYLQWYNEVHDLNLRLGVEVVRVSRDREFLVQDRDGNLYSSKILIVATGLFRPNIPDIPGVHLATNYGSLPTDRRSFTGQDILILGKGNSAFETANHLMPVANSVHLLSRHPVQFARSSMFAGDLRSPNSDILDTAQISGKLHISEGTVLSIERKDHRLLVQIEEMEALPAALITRAYDSVILCTGFNFDTRIFDSSCNLAMTKDGRLPALTSEWGSTNIDGLYFAGTLMQSLNPRLDSSAFIHGFRFNIRALSRILECKVYGRSWPHNRGPYSTSDLVSLISQRFVSTAELWMQPGVLCDLIAIMKETNEFLHFQGLPQGLLADCGLDEDQAFYTLSVEPSPTGGRVSVLGNRQEKLGSVPVIRYYEGNAILGEWWIPTEGSNWTTASTTELARVVEAQRQEDRNRSFEYTTA
jgi:thioredoxin reductase